MLKYPCYYFKGKFQCKNPRVWHLVNSKCYYFMNYDPPWNDWAGRYRMNYTEARHFCHVVGGKLFEPKNLKTNNLVNKAASKWLKISSYWIGINNITRDSIWR